MHALSGIRTHDPSVRASEDSSCLRQRGHWDRQCMPSLLIKSTSLTAKTHEMDFNTQIVKRGISFIYRSNRRDSTKWLRMQSEWETKTKWGHKPVVLINPEAR
jgi:hypothetical protein